MNEQENMNDSSQPDSPQQPNSQQGSPQQPYSQQAQPPYPPQQPYSQQVQHPYPPQPPYPSQQPYPPQVQQPMPYPPQYQQTYAYAPRPTVMPALPGEKDALFSTTGGLWMLIASIVFSLNFVFAIINNLLAGLVNTILLLLMLIGFWITFANGRKKNLSATGLQLIRVPYIIQFVFNVLSFSTDILLWIFTFNIFSLLIGIVSFVFECICFASVKKSLDMGVRISKNMTVAGMKAGVFAAVVMIISAAFTFLKHLVNYLLRQVLVEGIVSALGDSVFAKLIVALLGGSVFTIVAAVIALLASIAAAIVLLQFHKKIKTVNG